MKKRLVLAVSCFVGLRAFVVARFLSARTFPFRISAILLRRRRSFFIGHRFFFGHELFASFFSEESDCPSRFPLFRVLSRAGQSCVNWSPGPRLVSYPTLGMNVFPNDLEIL